MAITSRAVLKARFQKNKIPTQDDFANVIDSAINLADDGVLKSSGDPLSVKAEGTTQELLAFYESFESLPIPAWKINRKPGTNPGFNIATGDGTSRLFIDERTGAVNIGGINPVRAAEPGMLQLGDDTVANSNGQLLLARLVDINRNRAFKIGVTDDCGLSIYDLGHVGNRIHEERLNIDYTGRVSVKKGLEVNELLQANGDAAVTGKLDVTGPFETKGNALMSSATVTHRFEAMGDSLFRSGLAVNGLLEANGGATMLTGLVNGVLEVKGNTIARGEVNVHGLLNAKSNMAVAGVLDVNGDLNISKGFKMKGGVIKWGDGALGSDTIDPGLYSTTDGYCLKVATVNAPIKFFNNKTGERAASGRPNMIIGKNGTVALGTDDPLAISGCNNVLQIGDDKIEGSSGQLIFGRKQGVITRSVRMGVDTDGNFSLGDFDNQHAASRQYKEYMNINHLGLVTVKKSLTIDDNVGIGCLPGTSKLDVNGTLHIRGVENENALALQGAYITWNKLGGQGRTHFVNHGGNGPGGFMFENIPNGGTSSIMAHLNNLGDLFLKGDYKGNGALRESSDMRIKRNILSVDGGKDLALLNRLRIKDYDYLGKGTSERRKGIIAQEVEKFIPEAISQDTSFVADIFATPIKITAMGDEMLLIMAEPHHLVNGDLVRLILPHGDAECTATVVDEKSFRVTGNADNFKGVLVFGKQVSDFRRVNYNHLFTLNLSATQELSKKIDVLLAWKASLDKNMVLAD